MWLLFLQVTGWGKHGSLLGQIPRGEGFGDVVLVVDEEDGGFGGEEGGFVVVVVGWKGWDGWMDGWISEGGGGREMS